jgi:hypothetical protein
MLPVDIDDRRYLILDVSPIHQKDHDYFDALEREWTNSGREAFYSQMLNRDISKFNHRRRPETPALHEQKLLSLTGAPRLVYELLESGYGGVEDTNIDKRGIAFVSTAGLANRGLVRGWDITERALSLELEKIALHRKSIRRSIEGEQVRGYLLPELKEARERWTGANSVAVNWMDPEATWTRDYRSQSF